MSNNSQVQNLLQLTTHISKKYDDIAVITGERYNIFQILKVQRDELSHSAFIADLLNSNGRHGLSDKFLCLFINQFKVKFNENCHCRKQLEDFITLNSKVNIEQNITNNHGLNDGGRMDIIIKDKIFQQIIIENKIDAGDQYLQLIRYNNFDNKAPIFYLTKEGNPPEEKSIKGSLNDVSHSLIEQEHFVCISYKNDIIQWLESCLKETSNYPLLRETLNSTSI